MLNITFTAGAVEAGAALRYGSGSTKMMLQLAAPASQHGLFVNELSITGFNFQKFT
jgi:hypothetical protein